VSDKNAGTDRGIKSIDLSFILFAGERIIFIY